MQQGIYLSIIDIKKYKGRFPFSAGRHLVAVKENDDETSIKVLDVGNTTVGYIADYRESGSKAKPASEIYDLIGNYIVVRVESSTNTSVLCRIIDYDFKNEELLEFFIEKNHIGKKFPYDEGYFDDDDPDDFPYEFNLVGINPIEEDYIPVPYLVSMFCYKRTNMRSALAAQNAKKEIKFNIKSDRDEAPKSFIEHYNGYEKNGVHILGYPDRIDILTSWFPLSEKITESSYELFFTVYEGTIEKKRLLSMFDEFKGREILAPNAFQEYENLYLDVLKNILQTKVNEFRIWAKTNHSEVTEYNDNGEWCFCDEFDEMISTAIQFIEKYPVDKTTEQIINDLLYALARDSECGNIIGVLEKHDDWFSLLCRSSLKTEYRNAKWQLVEQLRYYKVNDNLQELVFDFLDGEDEYTESLALQTLGVINPEKAEEYAIHFLNIEEPEEDYEYYECEIIMALEVLNQINSPKLNSYLKIAEQSGNAFLESYVQMIYKRGFCN